MKRIGFVAVWVLFQAAGCSNRTCETSSQCGSGEVCGAASTCQAISCSDTYYAVDPADGRCRPLPACGNRAEVRNWTACADPCATLAENDCIGDIRCQPGYATDADNKCINVAPDGRLAPPSVGGMPPQGLCGGSRVFTGCHANPLRVDPCVGLDEASCKSTPECIGFQSGFCDCFSNAPCSCPASAWDCRVKLCGDYNSSGECSQHPECTSSPWSGDVLVPPGDFVGCFDRGFGSCFAMDETTCLRHSECHPVGAPCYCPPGGICKCGGGAFYFCEPDDGLQRCNSNADCRSDERCSNDEACAPAIGSFNLGQPGFGGGPIPTGPATASLDPPDCPGLCKPKGCTGYGEKNCVADPTCEPVYVLNCSPYGGGGFEASPSGLCSDGQGGVNMCAPCEPNFVSCVERHPGSEVDPNVSILQRDPRVVDAPMFSFPNVMKALAGGQDPAGFVDTWLAQLTTDITVDGKLAAARPIAAVYLANLPRLADGRIDLAGIGFQVTSLSNRIDLAGAHDCGEARITYALAGGVSDRRHRMTVIVELRQPDDGTHCEATALRWMALSKLKGDDLVFGYASLFGPLLTPSSLNQIRTNEFLVGQTISNVPDLATAWELREFHLGDDGGLHLALSKQAVDPSVTQTDPFLTWLEANKPALKAQQAIVPKEFLAVTSSENGSRIFLFQNTPEDFAAEQTINKMACAGCHTTETNSAFAHVGERWHGTGRAKISEFLRQELPKRAHNLWLIARGQVTQAQRTTSLVH
jgi:hypothetical protein